MRVFRVALTGDFLDETGAVAYGDIGLDRLASQPFVRSHFMTELAPRPDDPGYWSRLYSLEVTPEHIQDVDGLVVLRPWVKRSTFGAGAEDLVVIGRSGAGYDKIDLAACTEHGVAVFNAPLALNHSTASSALLFMLALAKRLPEQERIVRQGRWDRQAAVMGSEIQGRTLGIVGLGHSGRELARLVAPFAMRDPRVLTPRRPGRGQVAGRSADVTRRGLARVGLRQSALPAHPNDPAVDRCGPTGPDEAGRVFHQRRPRRAGRPAGAGGRPARSPDRRRRSRCLRGRAASCRGSL